MRKKRETDKKRNETRCHSRCKRRWILKSSPLTVLMIKISWWLKVNGFLLFNKKTFSFSGTNKLLYLIKIQIRFFCFRIFLTFSLPIVSMTDYFLLVLFFQKFYHLVASYSLTKKAIGHCSYYFKFWQFLIRISFTKYRNLLFY